MTEKIDGLIESLQALKKAYLVSHTATAQKNEILSLEVPDYIFGQRLIENVNQVNEEMCGLLDCVVEEMKEFIKEYE